MLARLSLLLCVWASLCVSWSCGDGSPAASEPGPLIDNTKWVASDKGEAIFGAPPEGSECQLTPLDCPEYPWPEGECVTLAEDSTCIVSFLPECFDQFTVLSVQTRMPDTRIPLCNWITLEQPSLRAIHAGDQVEIRAFHDALTAPVPGEARMSFVVGDELAFDDHAPIPSDSDFPTVTWTAPKDYSAGTTLLWHVDNHGANEYLLIEANVLLPKPTP